MTKQTPQGSQSLRRAIAILRTISQGPLDGMKLTDIAETNELHVATCHRLLKALTEEGLALFFSDTKTYRLGAETRRLGTCAERQSGLERMFAPLLNRVAEVTQDTVFLSVRSGADAVCLARRQGTYPVKTLILDVGSVRPLGVGAGSLALCAFLPEDKIDEILAANEARYPAFNLTRQEVAQLIQRARSEGYATNDGRVIREYTGVGVLLHQDMAEVDLSVSVAAINSRMLPERRKWVADTIKAAADETERAAGGRLKELEK